jgi:prepilin-type N-terminal cleavage/methylation domain-containing protein
MKLPIRSEPARGFSLLELLCVSSIILVLASLMLGPVSRVLGRVLADKWYDQASNLLPETVSELNQRFQGLDDFPLVTLDRIEAEGILKPRHLQFLKDRRVTFVPFAGSDPGDKIVIYVQLKRGFWTEGNQLMEQKEAITRVPK